jgi:tRNA nucleotidyltransferase (CCA-adding enzyme)
MEFETKVLAKVKPLPDDEKRIETVSQQLVEKVMATESAKEVEFEPCLVGSIAKNTYLKDPDIDLFLLFDSSLPRKDLDKYGVTIGREAIGGREHYAEHPYIRGRFEGYSIDIVPAYKVTDASQKMTAVDRTPFHTEYVKENLTLEQRDDVRLLKAFMKGIGTYGAEAKTQGFSGYLCEILVLRFGTFKDVLRAARDWKRGESITMEGPTETKFDGPLVFIDPVDPNRNVASAVSLESLSLFIVAAGAYLANPLMEFFFPKGSPSLGIEEIKEGLEGRGHILSLTLTKPDIIDDILYPQIRKFQRNLGQLLEQRDFKVIHSWSGIFDEEIVLLFKLEHFKLPHSTLHKGPPVWVVDNSNDFLSKWRDNPDARSEPFIKDGHWYVYMRRKYLTANELARSNLSSLDIGKDLNKYKPEIKISGPEIPSEQAIIKALSAILDKKMPWER